jgi:hypothetical protein
MGRSGSTFAKRQKELAQQERAREREVRRTERKERSDTREPARPGYDPDIAGIIPGPQPIPED